MTVSQSLLASLASPGQDAAVPLASSSATDTQKVIKLNVKVAELAPDVFAYLRKLDGITQGKISASLSPEKNLSAVKQAGESQGKSGSFFFFSEDKNFIIKTMTEQDLSTFKRIFVDYTRHVSRHPDSLLARVYGIFTIVKDDMVPVHLILMGNCMKTRQLKHVFDLKGSLVNREVKFKGGAKPKPSTTLKDVNLLNMIKSGVDEFLLFSDGDQFSLIKTLKRDSDLLHRYNIMDYSLLLAVEHNVGKLFSMPERRKTAL